jgi:hypothetical protein
MHIVKMMKQFVNIQTSYSSMKLEDLNLRHTVSEEAGRLEIRSTKSRVVLSLQVGLAVDTI